eukprot:352983-Chlamydomonas_euryale.AAC.10
MARNRVTGGVAVRGAGFPSRRRRWTNQLVGWVGARPAPHPRDERRTSAGAATAVRSEDDQKGPTRRHPKRPNTIDTAIASAMRDRAPSLLASPSTGPHAAAPCPSNLPPVPPIFQLAPCPPTRSPRVPRRFRHGRPIPRAVPAGDNHGRTWHHARAKAVAPPHRRATALAAATGRLLRLRGGRGCSRGTVSRSSPAADRHALAAHNCSAPRPAMASMLDFGQAPRSCPHASIAS